MADWRSDWVDWAMLAVLLLSVLVGVLRGFVFEVLALVGWVAALVVASWVAPGLDRLVAGGDAPSPLRFWGLYVVCFIGVLLLWKLAARAVQGVIRRLPIVGGLDRLLGAVFGVARALIVLLLITAGVRLTAAAASPAWQRSSGAEWLTAVWQDLRWAFPDGMSHRVDPCDDPDGSGTGGCHAV